MGEAVNEEGLKRGLRWLVTSQINKERENLGRAVESIEQYIVSDTPFAKERKEAREDVVLVKQACIDLVKLRDDMYSEGE